MMMNWEIFWLCNDPKRWQYVHLSLIVESRRKGVGASLWLMYDVHELLVCAVGTKGELRAKMAGDVKPSYVMITS